MNLRKLMLPVLAALALGLAGCVSAAMLLERAEDAWTRGSYAEAVHTGLDSYEKAVEENKDVEAIQSARDFLLERFPLANDYLSEQAETMLAGSDRDKAGAWVVYQSLVDMNIRIRDSIASSFLSFTDFRPQLEEAKNVAAQVEYVRVLELMGEDRRSSYIEAVDVLESIEILSPGYRDVRDLLVVCREAATVTIAIGPSGLYLDRSGNIPSVGNLDTQVYNAVRRYIQNNDRPEFVRFVSASGNKDAVSAGALLFITLDGRIEADSYVDDNYSSLGQISWVRRYRGAPVLQVVNLESNRTEVAAVQLYLMQSVDVEFYPRKFKTDELSSQLYVEQFGNPNWVDSQVSRAKAAFRQSEGRGSMTVWAEMEYGGRARFLEYARVSGAEGLVDMPITSDVYDSAQNFINRDLPAFLTFADLPLRDRLVQEMADGFFASAAVRDILTDLND